MIDLTNPVILIPTLAILLICVAISKKIKNPYIMLGILALNIGLLLSHFFGMNSENLQNEKSLYYSIAIDFAMLLISFLSYLWIDNIKAKEGGSKVIEDGISWFWDKI